MNQVATSPETRHDDYAVEVNGLGKCFHIYANPGHRLAQFFSRRPLYEEFWALNDVNFVIEPGSVVGILGRNGSGKSTLLQMLAGTLAPTHGEIRMRGRVAALLELGAGFNPDFTGIENVYLNASILGLSRAETEQRLDEILAFADIGEFVQQPVKNYSSGMFVRLAFAVAACVDPDVLLVDEALAVGDVQFQSKCFRRFEHLIGQGKTILFVTHSTEQVVRHCSRAILIDAGRVIDDGLPRPVVNNYLDRMLGVSRRRAIKDRAEATEDTTLEPDYVPDLNARYETRPGYCATEYRWGNGAAAIVDFTLTGEGEAAHRLHFEQGEFFSLRFLVDFREPCARPVFGLFVKTPDGVTVFGNSSKSFEPPTIIDVAAGERVVVSFRCQANLGPGSYLLALGVSADRDGDILPLDRRYDSIRIDVVSAVGAVGLADLRLECHAARLDAQP
jgi:lipopolysaccharide transport system ATP-binding protein